jgi:hypothetical protein
VPEESLARIRLVAQALPVFAIDFFGFECRLDAETVSSDCAMNLTPEGARMLAGQYSTPPPSGLRNGAWARLQRFYQVWGETRQTPFEDARATWLEFDTSTHTMEELAPNFLFGYCPDETGRPPELIVETIIPLLLGNSLSPKFRQNLARCLEARPRGTEDFQIGVMLARNIQAARVCVFDLPQEELFSYLSNIGWDGPTSELNDYLEAFRPYADFTGLHLDVGEKIYPHIGVEPNFVAGCWARQPHMEPRWEGQFAELLKRGLMTTEKRDALMRWIGHQSLTFDDQEMLLLRGLSHVKVVISPGRETIAKAYFGFAHRALTRSLP